MRKLLLAIGFAVTTVGVSAGAPNSKIAAACHNGQINAPKMISFWKSQRVIRDLRTAAGLVSVDVNSVRWKAIGHDAQVSIAIAAYCTIASADGHGTALVKGSEQEDLGSVVDGNFWR